MANIKSAVKKARQGLTKNQQNRHWKSRIKEAEKAVLQAKSSKVAETLEEAIKRMQKTVDKAAKTKAIHPNRAARIKSRLAKKLSS